MEYPHRPVQVQEVLESLLTGSDGIYVDGTTGSAGHSEAIGKLLTPGGRLICLDRDPEAIRLSRKRLEPLGRRATVHKANYVDMDRVLMDLGIDQVNGVLLDLGLSTFQIEQSGRGFSFMRDEPLDMRMDTEDDLTAFQIINHLPAAELKKILKEFGEERQAARIVKGIEIERQRGAIESSRQLARLIENLMPPSRRTGKRHPATLTFQSLRIAVNRELENLMKFLSMIPKLIVKGGRLVILTYHSLEDRIVKQAMMNWERACTCPPDLPVCGCGKKPLFRRLYKKGIRPGQSEINANPSARSAILRAAERI